MYRKTVEITLDSMDNISVILSALSNGQAKNGI